MLPKTPNIISTWLGGGGGGNRHANNWCDMEKPMHLQYYLLAV